MFNLCRAALSVIVMRRATVTATALFILVSLATSGCGNAQASGSRSPALRPLSGEAASETTSTNVDDSNEDPLTGTEPLSPSSATPSSPSTETLTPQSSRPAPSATVDPGSYNIPEGALEAEVVDILLAHFDNVVSALAADPRATSSPDHPARRAWAELVPPGSWLHSTVLDQLVHEPMVDGTRLVPGPDGVGYRHHTTRAKLTEEGALDFAWCGYSPGVRVDDTNGDVVDDGVAEFVGIGRALRRPTDHGPPWFLDELEHLDMHVMAAGSTDPCR